MKSIKVGYYSKPFDCNHIEADLSIVLKCFGNGHFKSLIEPARQLYLDGHYEEYTLFKNRLPAVTFSGIFNPKRSAANIQEYSSLIILDIDKAGDNLLSYKSNLADDPYVIAVWLSPSGDGLKFLVTSNVSYEQHKVVYNAAIEYFQNKYSIVIDKSGSDISRLCFVSNDNDIRINENYLTFDRYEEAAIKSATSPTKVERKKEYIQVKKDFSNESAAKLTFKKLYHFLSKRNISITDNYENWVRVGFAISNTFPYPVGYDLFMDLCRLDGSSHDESASAHLINSCYAKGVAKSTFSTILFLCKEKGYDISFNKKFNRKKKHLRN